MAMGSMMMMLQCQLIALGPNPTSRLLGGQDQAQLERKPGTAPRHVRAAHQTKAYLQQAGRRMR